MKRFDKEIIESFRQALVPRGASSLVKLQLNSVAYFEHEYVKDVIDDLERKILMAKAGIQELSPTDKLAFQVLRDSSWLDGEFKNEQDCNPVHGSSS